MVRAREATARVGWNPYLHNPRLQQHLHRIACPTLVVWGKHDKLIPLPTGEFLAQKIPGAQLAVYDNAASICFPGSSPRSWPPARLRLCCNATIEAESRWMFAPTRSTKARRRYGRHALVFPLCGRRGVDPYRRIFGGLHRLHGPVLGLVNGKEPPALVKNLVQDAVQGAVKQDQNENKLDFEVSSNVLAAVGWLLTFLYLLIPTTVAGGLIRGGAWPVAARIDAGAATNCGLAAPVLKISRALRLGQQAGDLLRQLGRFGFGILKRQSGRNAGAFVPRFRHIGIA